MSSLLNMPAGNVAVASISVIIQQIGAPNLMKAFIIIITTIRSTVKQFVRRLSLFAAKSGEWFSIINQNNLWLLFNSHHPQRANILWVRHFWQFIFHVLYHTLVHLRHFSRGIHPGGSIIDLRFFLCFFLSFKINSESQFCFQQYFKE